jgi:hypothetical protein
LLGLLQLVVLVDADRICPQTSDFISDSTSASTQSISVFHERSVQALANGDTFPVAFYVLSRRLVAPHVRKCVEFRCVKTFFDQLQTDERIIEVNTTMALDVHYTDLSTFQASFVVEWILVTRHVFSM